MPHPDLGEGESAAIRRGVLCSVWRPLLTTGCSSRLVSISEAGTREPVRASHGYGRKGFGGAFTRSHALTWLQTRDRSIRPPRWQTSRLH